MNVSIDPTVRSSLIEVLRAAIGSSEVRFASEPVPLRGGFWADLFVFSLADPPQGWPAELVARLMPDAQIAKRETLIQAAVADHGYPTPAVRASGGVDGPFGKAFMVMDRADGLPLLAGLSGGGAIKELPKIAKRMPAVLGRAMSRLHSLDAEPVRRELETAGVLPGDIVDHLLAAAELCDRTDLIDAAGWLQQHRPASSAEVLCHGDLHPFNVLGHAERYAVLDWSAARIGPREYDVAFTRLMLSEPPIAVPTIARPAIRFIGRWLAKRFVRAYEADGGTIDDRALTWNEGVICLRALTEVGSWVGHGDVDRRVGHPWLVNGQAFAQRLRKLTGVQVRDR
jgi:aminoglycoside phosphotransferase (APT) family kinase protein